MKKGFKILAVLLVLFLAAMALPGCGSDKEEELPEELAAVVAKAAAFAEKYAKRLSGEWGDMHALLIESGEGGDFEGYDEMQAVLFGFREESGVDYIYTMYPPGPKVVAPYVITVDGSVDVEEYGTAYDWEEEFTAAWDGEAAGSEYAWTDPIGNLVISAYAPVYDSEGNITAILGVDYPAPEFEQFPDWIDDGE